MGNAELEAATQTTAKDYQVSERENRVITTLAPEEYHAMERMSSSGIKQMLRSPAHFRSWKDTPTIATPAMQFGTVVHTLVLEPHHAEARIAVLPESAPDRRSKDGKEWHANFLAGAEGKVIISAWDYLRAGHAARAVRNSRGWSLIRPEGNIETSLLWRAPARTSGVLCKARPDYFAPDIAYCVDLKTTADASREAFARQMWNLRYDIQAAFYLEGLYLATGILPHSFAWCVVETDVPYGVAWYRMGQSEFEIARADIANGLELYATCVESQRWPGYESDIQDIRLPPWARSRRNNHQPQEY
jgi:exodeoxyribonuclease VIII